jgi:hypothetical protein
VTELDRAGLDRILPSAAGPADWDDVLGRVRVSDRRRRGRLLALAAAVLVVVGSASAIGAVREFVLDRGFIGLPPEGATPSAPESGELVVSFVGRSVALENEFRRVWVYADGRVIWFRGGENVALGGNPLEVGFLERRLTPEGVELVRSEFLATGLFDHDRELVGGPFIGASAHVRDGDRLVRVAWNAAVYPAEGPPATVDQVNALRRIDSLAADLDAWLPASAWDDPTIKAYVASKYAICAGWRPDVGPDDGAPAIDASRVLELLPPQLAHQVRARGWGGPGVGEVCSVVATKEARSVAGVLEDAGLERRGGGEERPRHESLYRLAYGFDMPDVSGVTFSIFFEPTLPHGEWVCTPCR